MSVRAILSVNSIGRPLARLRLLPVFIMVAVVGLAIKSGTFAGDLSRLVSKASAQETAAPAANGAEPKADQPKEKAQDEAGAAEATVSAPLSGDDEAVSATAAIAGISRSEMNLLQDLRKRRQQLEEQEQKAALREQILASTERRIDQKISELRTIEQKIAALVEKHEDQEDQQIQSIVKVYETMKPKDAAAIFERLDMDIQQQVALRMSDRKMAALLAEMDTDVAKTLTTRLATRNPLPNVEALGQETAAQ
ncbi:hypothetical protein AQ1_00747 [alpha proteobacterium Q-1]|nr:hypothetical protein AQ1_00747 [alpha proteobacterium Q-1]